VLLCVCVPPHTNTTPHPKHTPSQGTRGHPCMTLSVTLDLTLLKVMSVYCVKHVEDHLLMD
jgi:hypothetical protein